MIFHPDVLAAHAQFGGDLESMQKLFEYPDLKAEVERLRSAMTKPVTHAPTENVAGVATELTHDIVFSGRECRGRQTDQLEASNLSAHPDGWRLEIEPVAWLRPGEYVAIQNCPFGAMWISDKDDPRAFPVYAAQPPAQENEPIGYISTQTLAELLHDNSGDYKITATRDLMSDDMIAIYAAPNEHPGAKSSEQPAEVQS